MDLQTQEIQTQDHVATYYEDVRYKIWWSRAYHDWLFNRMVKLLQPNGKILDAGCGNGLLAEYLPNEKVWGVDISPEMIKHAQKRLYDARVGNVESLPYEDDFFDTIFARAIIHHLENPEQGVRELTRVLKPGGKIIFLDTRETILSKFPRKKMAQGEHFSELHRNMHEGEYVSMMKKYLLVETVEYVGYAAYTLLGFPDVFNLYKYVPFKKILTPFLINLDYVCARLPLIKKMGLGLLLVAQKPKNTV